MAIEKSAGVYNSDPPCEALQPIREQVVIATKFGFDIDPETGKRGPGTNSRLDQIKTAAEATNRGRCAAGMPRTMRKTRLNCSAVPQ